MNVSYGAGNLISQYSISGNTTAGIVLTSGGNNNQQPPITLALGTDGMHLSV